jgi:hypothetical protein
MKGLPSEIDLAESGIHDRSLLTLILPAEVIYDSYFFIGKMLQKVSSTGLLKTFKFLPMNVQNFFIR